MLASAPSSIWVRVRVCVSLWVVHIRELIVTAVASEVSFEQGDHSDDAKATSDLLGVLSSLEELSATHSCQAEARKLGYHHRDHN